MKTEPKKMFSYGIGAAAVVTIAVGLAAIIYGLNLVAFDLYVFPAWVLGPLGVYTAVYSLVAGSESTYYLVWGTIMIAFALISAFYNVTYVLPILGALVIVLAVIGVIAYMRSKR
jgi:hypothetical protein